MSPAVQPRLIDRLRPVLSDDRLGTYLTAAGFDPDRALRLYLWNAEIGDAFHLPIQAVEVALRNRIVSALISTYGANWWTNRRFQSDASGKTKQDIQVAIGRIRQRGQIVTSSQLVASLSFGFWISLLHRRFNPSLWSAQLRITFPSLPAHKGRDDLYALASAVLFLRNRIDHHEPVIKMNLSEAFSQMMLLLGWICPVKLSWIRPKCRVPGLLRLKP